MAEENKKPQTSPATLSTQVTEAEMCRQRQEAERAAEEKFRALAQGGAAPTYIEDDKIGQPSTYVHVNSGRTETAEGGRFWVNNRLVNAEGVTLGYAKALKPQAAKPAV